MVWGFVRPLGQSALQRASYRPSLSLSEIVSSSVPPRAPKEGGLWAARSPINKVVKPNTGPSVITATGGNGLLVNLVF